MHHDTTTLEAPKKAYSTPTLTTHGDVRELTQHHDCHEEEGCASHLFDHHKDKW